MWKGVALNGDELRRRLHRSGYVLEPDRPHRIEEAWAIICSVVVFRSPTDPERDELTFTPSEVHDRLRRTFGQVERE
jgi:hypothetical protein